jgi:hypothetical protein
MMATAPPFFLNHAQAARLQAYMKIYRQHAFDTRLPTTERNNLLRLTQSVQGKLIQLQSLRDESLPLVLTQEEKTALKTVITELLNLYAQQPSSKERIKTLGDLAALKQSLNGF